jgi:hypothetical protein
MASIDQRGTSVRQATLPLRDAAGAPCGALTLRLLPRDAVERALPLLLALPEAPPDEQVQALEGGTYLYGVEGLEGALALEPAELFEPDDETGARGRFSPGLRAGRVEVAVSSAARAGRAALVVRSSKLDFERHHAWMVRDLAAISSEWLLERFAPADAAGAPDPAARPLGRYAPFELLYRLCDSGELGAALGRVRARPHTAWESEEVRVASSQGARAHPRLAQAWAAPGPRVQAAGGRWVPERVPARVAQASLDTPPNRFVRWALGRWQAQATAVAQALAQERPGPARARGERKVAAVQRTLDAMQAWPGLAEVALVAQPPRDHPVLRRRAGYRELWEAHLETEASLRLQDGPAPVWAGLRDVATLYERWCQLTVAREVRRLLEAAGGEAVLSAGPGGWTAQVDAGLLVQGWVRRGGKGRQVELWAQRTFGAGPEGSWSRPLRPDLSLRIQPQEAPGPHWLHFDAKYRLERLGDDGAPDGPGDRAASKREDLHKMHAYRDAIARTRGAYVLFPGTENEAFSQRKGELPGLGALALRPSEAGPPEGASALRALLAWALE